MGTFLHEFIDGTCVVIIASNTLLLVSQISRDCKCYITGTLDPVGPWFRLWSCPSWASVRELRKVGDSLSSKMVSNESAWLDGIQKHILLLDGDET